MELDLAFIASSALAASEGQLSALGIASDTFYSEPFGSDSFPSSPSPGALGASVSFSFVARFLGARDEAGERYPVTINIVDSAAAAVATGQVEIVVPSIRDDVPATWALPLNLIVPLVVAPKKYGEYRLEVRIADCVKSIAFRILPTGRQR